MPIKVREGLPLVFVLAMAAELAGVPSGDAGAQSMARGSLTPLLNQAVAPVAPGDSAQQQSQTRSQVAQTCSNGAWRRC